MKNLLTATIIGDFGDNPSRRIKLVCRKDGDRYQWTEDETGNSAEVSGRTLQEAKEAAIASWGSKDWDIKASWIEG